MSNENDLTATATTEEWTDIPIFVAKAKGGQTDWGLAQKLVGLHGEDLRYVPSWKSWLVWDGKRWVKDDTDEAVRRVKQTIHAFRSNIKTAIRQLKEERKSLDSKDGRSSPTRIMATTSSIALRSTLRTPSWSSAFSTPWPINSMMSM